MRTAVLLTSGAVLLAVTPGLPASATAAGRTFYVSPAGDDAGTGTSPAAPWRTLARVSAAVLRPGDTVLLQAGARHPGTLALDRSDAGSAERPVTIGSYGRGRAEIDAGDGGGISVTDTAGVQVRDLLVRGSGASSNSADGIAFFTDRADGAALPGIGVRRVEVTGFGRSGLVVGAWSASWSGFRRVRISGVDAHDNGSAGISTFGWYAPGSGRWSHADVQVDASSAHDNLGVPGSGGNSGNGIVVSGVDGAVVSHSRAYRNGARNDFPGGGPVGIWAWEATHVTIRGNESYDNRTATLDGGGFDLDGGVTHSVMRDNVSHGNDGAGYLVAEFAGAGPLTDVVVRDNVSTGDGRRNGYGGLQVYDASGSVRRVIFERNVVVSTPAAGSRPTGLSVQSPTSQVTVRDNTFIAYDGLPLLRVVPGQRELHLLRNRYATVDGPFLVQWQGAEYSSLDGFRRATGQEGG